MQLFTDVVLQSLLELHKITGNLGWSILLFTLLVRSLLLPLSLPSMKSQKQLQALKPELDALKKKHGGNQKQLQVAQMELYKKYNINPLSGCLPQVVQIIFLILLYQVLVTFISTNEIHGILLEKRFLWLDLAKPDSLYVLPLLAGVTQLVLSVMILPGGEVADIIPNKSGVKKVQEANKKEEGAAEMAATMQKQMLFLMPVMTGVIALSFPSGLALYWVASTLFSLVQQWVFSGPGGLVIYTQRAILWVRAKTQK